MKIAVAGLSNVCPKVSFSVSTVTLYGRVSFFNALKNKHSFRSDKYLNLQPAGSTVTDSLVNVAASIGFENCINHVSNGEQVLLSLITAPTADKFHRAVSFEAERLRFYRRQRTFGGRRSFFNSDSNFVNRRAKHFRVKPSELTARNASQRFGCACLT